MENIKIATAQFESRSNDKEYNLSIIDKLSKQAATERAKMIAFHECSITGYTFARNLSRSQMLELAEIIPGGKSIDKLIQIAEKNNIDLKTLLFPDFKAEKLF